MHSRRAASPVPRRSWTPPTSVPTPRRPTVVPGRRAAAEPGESSRSSAIAICVWRPSTTISAGARSASGRRRGARAQAELARQLLDALDDLDRFWHVDPATTDAATVIEGVGMVARKLSKSLQAAGLEVVDPVDQPFDPNRHEAVATAPAASAEEDHTVAQVYQPGYVFGNQLLRPARVVVRQWQG